MTVSLLQMPPEHPPGFPPKTQQQAEGFQSESQMPPMPPSHPPVGDQTAEGQAPRRFADLPDIVSRLDQTEGLRESPKTFEIATSIASEYAKANRAEEAAFYYGQAWEKTVEVRELFVKLQKLEVGTVVCEEVNADKELELEFAKAKAQASPSKQAACVRTLLPKVTDMGKQLASFQVLAKELEGDKKTWEALLALDHASLDASYALGILLLETEGDELASLERAQKLLQNVAQTEHLRANLAKGFLTRVEAALEAGGNSKVKRSRSKAFRPSGLSFALPTAEPASGEAQTR
jgi:hypothetical protein